MERISIDNSVDNFIVRDMLDRLGQGITVRIAFGGDSMRPLIRGDNDLVHLEPLCGALSKGEVYLFLHEGHCVIHRLHKMDGDLCFFRGDNNIRGECVKRKDVVAKLKAVERSDGSMIECNAVRWRLSSRIAVCLGWFAGMVRRVFCRRNRRWLRWLYFAVLLILMWGPMGVFGVPLDNFVFGIRFDHLVHASVYLPCALFMSDFAFNRRGTLLPCLLASLLLGITTETVQYFLPYRGFDINDLVANALGVTTGWLALRIKN